MNIARRFIALAFVALVAAMGSVAHASEPARVAGRYVIDVRTAEEWERGHVEGAVLIPHTEIGARIGSVIAAHDAPISLYCGSGKRAGKALETLKAMGYSDLENLGGFEDAQSKLAQRAAGSHE
jgi:phage shock protein E